MTQKVKTSVTLEKSLIDWIDKMIGKKRFANRSHAIEYSITFLKEKLDEDK